MENFEETRESASVRLNLNEDNESLRTIDQISESGSAPRSFANREDRATNNDRLGPQGLVTMPLQLNLPKLNELNELIRQQIKI